MPLALLATLVNTYTDYMSIFVWMEFSQIGPTMAYVTVDVR
jgi:hypothetical protein